MEIYDVPLISVIMPAYNCEDTIRASVLSILKQTIEKLELLIVDDCSTDSTLGLIAELTLIDSRIKLLENTKNSGVAASRNRAIDASSGEFIAFIDSDDLWELDKLERQLTLMQETGCGLCYASYDYFDEDGQPVYRPYIVPGAIDYDGLLKENVIGLSTVMLRGSELGGLRFNNSIFHEDFALWLKLLHAGIVARGISEVLTHNRIGGRSHNKWDAMKNRWQVYRSSEGLSFAKSIWYLTFYAIVGLKKYWK